MVATVVAAGHVWPGSDYLYDYWSTVASDLTAVNIAVLARDVQRTITGEYTATLTVQAPTMGLSAIEQSIGGAIARATGYYPASVSATMIDGASTGQPASGNPAGGILDDFLNLASSLVRGTSVLTWALVIGGIVVIVAVARRPERFARLLTV